MICGDEDDVKITRSFEQIGGHNFPDHPSGTGPCHTLFDPTYAPAGKHVAFWYPFAPYALEDGPEGWERRRKEYTARLLQCWRSYAPNLTSDNLLATWLYTPRDIPLFNANMVDGALRMDSYVPAQVAINRPHPLLADYRTPIEGLYLTGSSSHGGGANGAP